MSYEKYYSGGWADGESGATPITADALNHMENGIKSLSTTPPLKWRYISETYTVASGASLVTLSHEFPSLNGYTRRVMAVATSNANVIAPGYVLSGSSTIQLRVNNLSSADISVTFYMIYAYLSTDCTW